MLCSKNVYFEKISSAKFLLSSRHCVLKPVERTIKEFVLETEEKYKRWHCFLFQRYLFYDMFREHNRIAREMAIMNPHWNDETLFQVKSVICLINLKYIIWSLRVWQRRSNQKSRPHILASPFSILGRVFLMQKKLYEDNQAKNAHNIKEFVPYFL